jgi:transposase
MTPCQKHRLVKLRQEAASPRVWGRITAILLLAKGTLDSNVCNALSISRNTLTNWKHRWLQGRYFRLADSARTGRPPKATRRYLRLLRQAVERGPRAYGYIFSVWSAARLAEHLRRRTSIRLGAKRIRELLKKLGFVYRRPKHTLKGRQNRQEVQAAKKHLDALKKGPWPRDPDTNSGLRTRPISTYTRT